MRIYEASASTPYTPTLRASFAASNTAGATHSYQALYHPQTSVLQVARDGNPWAVGPTRRPLASGDFLSLRTDGASVQFDDIAVSEVVKYYYIGGQRIAMRRGGTLYYLHSDHLGSTSVATNSAGAEVTSSRVQYYPYGGTRSGGGGRLTEYRFTGQRREPSIGIYDYGARYYEPRIGRFQSPDPIVPSPGDPQSLNRYSYVLNNPVRYIDSSGHCGPLTPVCLGLLLGGMALLLQGDSPDLNVTAEDVASQRLGGALFVGGAGLTAGLGVASQAATAACADGNCTNEVTGVAERAQNLLKGKPGYNVSPESYFGKEGYTQIGRNFTFVTDGKAVSDVIGQFDGKGNVISVTVEQAGKLEQALGLGKGSLANGFRISAIEKIGERNPASPVVGSKLFLGPGQGLPGGGPVSSQ